MAKKKEMNRTSGTAKRKAPNMSQSERIGRQRQAAAAETGPRDRFNPAAAQGVVDTLGFGVNSSGKFEFNPIATLGMALPVGKVLKAAKALRAVGNIGKATALEARVLAKQAGRELGPDAARNFGPKTLPPVGPTLRKTSESVFPRLPNVGGDSPSLLRGSRDLRTFDKYADLTNEGAGRFKTTRAIKQATAKRGIKVTEQGASKMARLLADRTKRKGK